MRLGRAELAGCRMPTEAQSAADCSQPAQEADGSTESPLEARVDQGPDGRTRPEVINSDPERSALSEGQVTSPTCQAHDVPSSTLD